MNKTKTSLLAIIVMVVVIAPLLAMGAAVFGPATGHASAADTLPDCQYGYSTGLATIIRTQCTDGTSGSTTYPVSNAVFKAAAALGSKFIYVHNDAGGCAQGIITQVKVAPGAGLLSGTLEGSYPTSNGCVKFANTTISITTTADSPSDLMDAYLGSLFNKACAKDYQVSTSQGDACVNKYEAQAETCVTNVLNSIDASDSNKDQEFKDQFADCMLKLKGNTLTKAQIESALPSDIYTEASQADQNGASDVSGDNTCESSGFFLSWAICGIIDTMSRAVDGMFTNIVTPLLETKPLSDTPEIYSAWSNFRVYGDVFLVIAVLIIVFGESIGGGLIDAYSVKKILPRILAAAILINISYYLVAIAVDVTNIVGIGMRNLITVPFHATSDFSIHIHAATGSIATILGTGAAWEATAAAITAGPELVSALAVFVLLPAALITLAIIITVFIRKALIILLVIVSPVAFALYCLPNTEKYFRQWWDTLFRTLLVFPIIAVMFALGDVMGVVIFQVTTVPILNQLLSLLAFFTPLLLIPFSFRIAGGILARGHEFLNQSSKRGHQAILGNVNDKASLRNRTRRNLGVALSRQQDSRIKAGREAEKEFGRTGRRTLGGRFQSARGRMYRSPVFGDVDRRLSLANADEREVSEAMSATGRDGLRYAALGYKIAAGQAAPGLVTDFDGAGVGGSVQNFDRWFDSKGRQITEADHNEGHRRYGRTIAGAGQQVEYALRKAQSDADIGNMREAFARNALAEGWDDGELMDAWAAGTFGHKDKWKSEWYSSPRNVTDPATGRRSIQFRDVDQDTGSYDKMVKEFHSVPEQFKLSSIRAQDWHAMGGTMDTLQAKMDSGQQLTKEEAERFVRTNEVLDTMSARGMVTRDNDGEFTASGASAETQKVIGALYKNRRYDTAQAQSAGGQSSGTDRVIYNKARVDQLTTPPPLAAGPVMDRDAAIRVSAIPAQGGPIQVSGDRSTITKQVTP